MGRAFVYKERVSLSELLSYIDEQQNEAKKFGMFLYEVHLQAVSGYTHLFDVTLVFGK